VGPVDVQQLVLAEMHLSAVAAASVSCMARHCAGATLIR
jgi:hypothetical protein